MKIIQQIAIIFFDILDKYIQQKRILKFFQKTNIKLNTYFDVGSHKGTYTDLILNNFKVKKVFMFEPQEHIFNFIKKKYKNLKKVKIYNNAISDRNIFQTLYYNYHDLTSSLTKLDEKNNYLILKAKIFGKSSKKMIYKKNKVKTVQLSKIIKSNKIKKIDLLKIDTEGHELQVLKSLNKNIKNISYILVEFHNDSIYLNYSPKKVHAYLIKNNFILKEVYKFPFTTWEDRIYKIKKP